MLVKNNNPLKTPISIIKIGFKGAKSYSPLFAGSETDYGVIHCDDLIYLFRSPLLFGDGFFEKDSVEAKVSHHYVKSFVHFAKTG